LILSVLLFVLPVVLLIISTTPRWNCLQCQQFHSSYRNFSSTRSTQTSQRSSGQAEQGKHGGDHGNQYTGGKWVIHSLATDKGSNRSTQHLRKSISKWKWGESPPFLSCVGKTDNISLASCPYGNTRQYALRKLRKDCPMLKRVCEVCTEGGNERTANVYNRGGLPGVVALGSPSTTFVHSRSPCNRTDSVVIASNWQ
jgi:hypothetical protein